MPIMLSSVLMSEGATAPALAQVVHIAAPSSNSPPHNGHAVAIAASSPAPDTLPTIVSQIQPLAMQRSAAMRQYVGSWCFERHPLPFALCIHALCDHQLFSPACGTSISGRSWLQPELPHEVRDEGWSTPQACGILGKLGEAPSPFRGDTRKGTN